VIYSVDSGHFYYGYYTDLEQVLEMHNSGQILLTKGKGPYSLLFSEVFENRLRAIRQASFYRSVKGQRFLKNILNL
jgi:putative endonuclease